MARSEFWRHNPAANQQPDDDQWRRPSREASWQREDDDHYAERGQHRGYRMADQLPPHSTREDNQRFGRGPQASFNDRWEDAYGRMSPREFKQSGGIPGPMPSQWQQSGQGYGRATGSAWLDRDDPSMRSGNNAVGYGPGASFRGRGPRGYQRSDDRIREDVCECLMDDDHLDASDIEVKVQNGEVSLSGTVNSRWEKRRAEDLVEMLSAVQDVHNELRVNREQRDSQGMQPSGMQRREASSQTAQRAADSNGEDIDSKH